MVCLNRMFSFLLQSQKLCGCTMFAAWIVLCTICVFPLDIFLYLRKKNEHSCLRHGKLIRTLPLYGTKITASLSPNISFTLLLISFSLLLLVHANFLGNFPPCVVVRIHQTCYCLGSNLEFLPSFSLLWQTFFFTCSGASFSSLPESWGSSMTVFLVSFSQVPQGVFWICWVFFFGLF